MGFLNIIIKGFYVLFFFVLLVFKFDQLSVHKKAPVCHAKLSFRMEVGKRRSQRPGVEMEEEFFFHPKSRPPTGSSGSLRSARVAATCATRGGMDDRREINK